VAKAQSTVLEAARREVVITKESITEGKQPLVVTERARTKREA
jgi:hypothetical protein